MPFTHEKARQTLVYKKARKSRHRMLNTLDLNSRLSIAKQQAAVSLAWEDKMKAKRKRARARKRAEARERAMMAQEDTRSIQRAAERNRYENEGWIYY